MDTTLGSTWAATDRSKLGWVNPVRGWKPVVCGRLAAREPFSSALGTAVSTAPPPATPPIKAATSAATTKPTREEPPGPGAPGAASGSGNWP
jgi:hypothetical protein